MDNDYGDYYSGYSGSYGYGAAPPPHRGGGMGMGSRGPPPAGYPGYPPSSYPPSSYPPVNSASYNSPLDQEVAAVLHEMRAELASFEASPEFAEQYRNSKRLLNHEVTKLEQNVDPEWLELDIEKEIKLEKKVLIPTFRHPRFNFVGKVIGPKGITLQNIAKVFKVHIAVLGRGSTRDKQKEQELLATGDPQYAHFNGPLHVKVETTAVPALAYKRIHGVLDVLAQLLKPVKETFIEGITPPLDSTKKEEDTEEIKKEPVEEKESKLKIDEKDYASELRSPSATRGESNRGSRGGGSGRGGGGRGGPVFNNRGESGPPGGYSRGPMRGGPRGGGFNGGPPGGYGSGPMRGGGNFAGRGDAGGRGFGGRGRGPRAAGPMRGPSRFAPY